MVEPFVDVAFPLKGKSLPLDHGYALFGAVSRIVPVLHDEAEWGLFPVHGSRLGHGELSLLATSLLTIRMPQARVGDVLSLTGKSLGVDGREVVVGIPRIFPLQSRPVLQSRFVTIKKFHEEEAPFAEAVRRQLTELDVSADAKVTVGVRRVAKVANHTIVGFAVGIAGLNPAESLRVQTSGIGGRRHMGAGLFLPLGRSS